MGQLKIIGISTSPPAGHNSLNAEFKYKHGEVAPHVQTRQYGSMPFAIPADIHYYTRATPIKEVLEQADELAEQYVQAIAEYIHRPSGVISSDSAYMELTRKMGAKTLLSPLPAPVPVRKLMIIGQ